MPSMTYGYAYVIVRTNREKALTYTSYDDPKLVEIVPTENLIEHRSEVVKMMQLDYTFERQLELEREESYTKGRKQGVAQGRSELIEEMLRNKKTPEQIADFCNCDIQEICDVQEKMRTKIYTGK